MKNYFFLLITLLMFVSSSFAQFSGGIKAGGNYTNVIGTDASRNKYKPSFHVGGFVEYQVSSTISLQGEAVYSVKGFLNKYEESVTTPNSTISQKVNVLYSYSYIDVPFIINIHFGQMGSYLGLGPQLSFLAGATWDGTVSTTTTLSTTTPPTSSTVEFTYAGNDKTGYSKVDFGAVIGTGAKWESGIEYCIRAGYGLTNMLDPQTQGYSSAWRDNIWHNLVFSVSLGYGFGKAAAGNYKSGGHHYKKHRR